MDQKRFNQTASPIRSKNRSMRTRQLVTWLKWITLLTALLLVVSIISLCIGSTAIPLKKVLYYLFSESGSVEHYHYRKYPFTPDSAWLRSWWWFEPFRCAAAGHVS